MDKFTVTERELTLAQAEQRILAELEGFGLHLDIRTLGSKIVATHASVSSHKPQRSARGAGKGYAEQARVGALYETLEHYLSDHCDTSTAHYIAPAYFSNAPLFDEDSVLGFITKQSTRTACRTYINATDQSSFYYPIALCTPDYSCNVFAPDTTDYRSLRRYTSNSGTAIGATYNEALLHAVNECIERDAVSLFLLDHFYYENHSPLRRIVRLPDDDDDVLGRLWSDAEAEIGAEIVLVDISNEFLPKTYLAFSIGPCVTPRVFGTGCSLMSRHGAWRALTELVQLHHGASDHELKHSLRNAERHLKPFPRLLRCLRFDLNPLLNQCEQQYVALPPAHDQAPLTEQINLLAKDLQQQGRTLGISPLHQTRLGTTLVNVVIPGLERFFVVSSGNVVVPQARGRRLQRLQGVRT
jgi:ribosomal protein S12 methylthiotransferase accessory factor